MLNDIKIEIPSWIGVVDDVHCTDIGISDTLDKVVALSEGVKSLSVEDFQENPALLEGIQRKITEIATDVGIAPVTFIVDDFFPTPAVAEQQPNPEDVIEVQVVETNISQENAIVALAAAAVKRIINFIRSLKDWFLSLFKKGKIMAKSQETIAKTSLAGTKKNLDAMKKADTPNVTTHGERSTVVVNLPTKAYVLFHTPKHIPKLGYRYNSSNLNSAIKGVKDNMMVYFDAIEVEIDTILEVVSSSIKDVLNDKPIPSSAMFQLSKSRMLAGLVHNNFECIGFGIKTKPITNEELNRDMFDMTNLARTYNWYGDGTFEFTLDLNEYINQAGNLVENIEAFNRRIDALQTKLNRSDALKRLSQIKDYQIAVGDNDAVSARTLRRLSALQTLAAQTQLLTATTSAYVTNYNNIVVQLLTGIQRATNQP